VIVSEIEKRGKKEEKKNPEMESKGNNKNEFSSDDEASPRAILDAPVSGTESDNSGSSSFSLYSPEDSSPVEGKLGWKESNMMQWKSMIDVFKFKSVRKLTTIPLLAAVNNDIAKKGLTKKLARIRSAEDTIDIGVIPTKPSWRNFDYDELASATNDFSSGIFYLGIRLIYLSLSIFIISRYETI